MLEPNKSSRFMRRRLVRQKSGSRPAQPNPRRSPEGYPLLPPDLSRDVTEMRQPGHSPSAPVPLNSQMQRRGSQRPGHTPSPPEDSTRFNLRHLLNDRPGAAQGRVPQRRKDGKAASRSRAHLSSPISYPLSHPQSHPQSRTGLQPVSGANPGALRQPSRSKLTQFRRPGQASSPVRVLNPYPVAVPAPTGLRRPQRRSRQKPSPLLYLTRLLILGVGLCAIAGTILSVWDPSSRERPPSEPTLGLPFGNDGDNASNVVSRDLTPGGITPLPVALKLSEPIAPLATTIQSLTAQYPGLSPGVFLVDLDTGAYLDLNGSAIFSAASTIKVPVLVAFLQDVDAGKIRLDEMLVMQQADVATGSGEMQYQPVGTQYTALETAVKMITISDNTATNMLITRMGGAQALNQRFRSWGLTNTVIRNPLADLEGTNITSPKDLTGLLVMVSQGDLLSLRSRDRLFEIMQNTVTNTLLPSGLDTGATIAHKTGNIDTMVGDTGIVDVPNGKRYVVTVIVQRPAEDDRAQELIRQISRAIYQQFTPAGAPQMTTPIPTQGSRPGAEAPANPGYGYPNSSTPNPSEGNPLPNAPLSPGSSYPNSTGATSPAQNSR